MRLQKITLFKHPKNRSKTIQWTLSLLIFCCTVLLCRHFIQQFRFNQHLSSPTDGHLKKQKYLDMDHDGEHDLIGKSTLIGIANIKIETDNNLQKQANLRGAWFGSHFPFNGDYDGDGVDEFYALTLLSDSILITGYAYHDFTEPSLEKFIIHAHGDSQDLNNRTFQFVDLNNDGFKELLFDVNAGYAIDPRVLVAFDIRNDSLWYTPTNWGAYLRLDDVVDLDHDGELEIIAEASKPENIHTGDYIYGDKEYLLFILNKDLSVKYSVYRSRKDQIAFHQLHGRSFLFQGNKAIEWGSDTLRLDAWIESEGTQLHLGPQWQNQQLAYFVDHDLGTRGSFFLTSDFQLEKVPVTVSSRPIVFDIDRDGEDELISGDNRNSQILIHDGVNQKRSVLDLESPPRSYTAGFQNGKVHLIAEVGNNRHYYILEKNPWYHIAWPAGLLSATASFFLIGFIIKYRQYRRESLNQQIYSLQLKSIKNHVDPHFTFNILNSIRMLLIKNDGLTAEKYFDKFTLLLRHNLINSDNIKSTIGEEFKLAESYLSLEKFRLENRFNYSIDLPNPLLYCIF